MEAVKEKLLEEGTKVLMQEVAEKSTEDSKVAKVCFHKDCPNVVLEETDSILKKR